MVVIVKAPVKQATQWVINPSGYISERQSAHSRLPFSIRRTEHSEVSASGYLHINRSLWENRVSSSYGSGFLKSGGFPVRSAVICEQE